MSKNEAPIALYRRYRPKTFKEVLGQEQVVKVLEGAVKEGNIAHAYLFAGTRGTGKTSVARILAREIGTSEKDLYEIDAASNRGIDDVRELREAVNTVPFDSKYKVYIVDEVHMLTKEAFNALLKTLEEPPPHAVFVLATTEMHKLPDTVISRCEVHQFRKPSRSVLKSHILDVAKREGFTLEQASGELIALLAEGSFRDAQGILQKVISSSKDKKVSVGEVETVTGAPKGTLVNALVAALHEGDAAKGLSAIRGAAEAEVNITIFAKLLLEKIRAVLLLRFASDMKDELKEEFGDEDFVFLESIAGDAGSKIRSDTLSAFLEAYGAIGRAYIPQLPLELAVMRLSGGEESGTLFGQE
ncbi:DNA polymerase III subunit gamma/tau [Candidatus Wolfebacteria bacterium]|nr:DNA polymerase III subunit gamma/tau [Candidatus Wolfebacteria bacterium]